MAQGKLPRVYFDRVTFDELAEAFLEDYRMNMKDTLVKAERSAKYLGEAFGGMKAIDITSDKIKSTPGTGWIEATPTHRSTGSWRR